MQTFWALIRTDGGLITRVTVNADNTYAATQMLRAMYGSMMLSESAAPVV